MFCSVLELYVKTKATKHPTSSFLIVLTSFQVAAYVAGEAIHGAVAVTWFVLVGEKTEERPHCSLQLLTRGNTGQALRH